MHGRRSMASLERFVDAQDEASSMESYHSVFDSAMAELDNGEKWTHWMWFVFPQLEGLSSSHMGSKFGLKGVQEAERYLQQPVLKNRLFLAVDKVHQYTKRHRGSLMYLFGGRTDATKFVSCVTLFQGVASHSSKDDATNRFLEQCVEVLGVAYSQGQKRCLLTSRALVERYGLTNTSRPIST